ncbi:MAG: DNA polymerase I [Desulfobacteraceae bacterium]|nr:MAG: DNA polymerase I [Desulfobacteraceae bacterium]
MGQRKQANPVKETVYLIDGTAYIHRAYHAIRGLANSKGLPTNAIYGFTRILIKLMEDRKPEYAGMFFDSKGRTFRHEMFEAYKANRRPMTDDLSVQIPFIREVAAGFNLPIFETPGFEADDLIGTLARMAEKEGFDVVIVTGDKDFVQLITPSTSIWDPMKDAVLDLKHVQDCFGVPPSQMVEVMALTGDSSDNIPGVPGIGQKTGLALIQKFGDLETLYQRIDQGVDQGIERIPQKKVRENLIAFRDQAFLSRKLAAIRIDVPAVFNTEDFRVREPNRSALSRLFKDFEFRQLQDMFPEKKQDLSRKRYCSVCDADALDGLVRELETAGEFALATATTSRDSMKAELVGISFSVRPDEAFYIPFIHDHTPCQLDRKETLERLRPVLEDGRIKKIGQDLKYDRIVLKRSGVDLAGISFDTMLASYLLNPSKRAHNLDQIALDFLNHKTIRYEDLIEKGQKEKGFNVVSLEKAVPYACEDADIVLLARNALAPKLESLGLTDLMEKIEIPLLPVLVKMEMRGIRVDKQRLQSLSDTFCRQLEIIEGDIYRECGEEFNINSSQQLSRILFEKLKLPVVKRTKKKTGQSTDVDVLTMLAAQHQLPALILSHRTLGKLKSTYADALLELIHPQTGRIHTSFNQTVTATGRLSSSDPNLQNIPIRTEEGRQIRSAFIPEEGWELISADYSQIELRILAHCSEDEIFIDAFQKGEDIHTRTACEVFGVPPERLTPELRRQAKAINFGIIYGMSPFGLSKQLGISQKMAKTYIDNYFSRYQGIKRFIDQTVENARKSGKTSTLLDRIRLLPEINSANPSMRGFAERIAINAPIQGTAADFIKIAMIRVDHELETRNLKAAMLLSVHDELVFEAPPQEIETVIDIVKTVMEGVWDLRVPIRVNISRGKDWAEVN